MQLCPRIVFGTSSKFINEKSIISAILPQNRVSCSSARSGVTALREVVLSFSTCEVHDVYSLVNKNVPRCVSVQAALQNAYRVDFYPGIGSQLKALVLQCGDSVLGEQCIIRFLHVKLFYQVSTIKISACLGSRGRPHFTDRIQKEWPQAVRSALHLRSTLHRFFYYTFPFQGNINSFLI